MREEQYMTPIHYILTVSLNTRAPLASATGPSISLLLDGAPNPWFSRYDVLSENRGIAVDHTSWETFPTLFK